MFSILKQTLKSSMLYGAGTISSKLIGFLLIPLYTSYLTTSDFGILSIVEITSTLLTAVISLKINSAFFRWYWDKDYIHKQKSIFFTSIILLFILAVFIFWGFYFYADLLSQVIFETTRYSYLLILMYISASLQVTLDLVLYLMRLQDKAVYYSTVTIIKLVVALVLIIIFVTLLDRKVEGIYEAIIISQIVFIIITSRFILINSQIKFELFVFWDMLKFSIPLIFAEISGVILTISDRYCLNFLSSASDVGIYSLGYKISNTVRVFVYSSAMLAVAPLIYKYIDKPNNKRFYSKLLTYFAFSVMIFTIIISIFADNLIYIIAKDKSYWPAIDLIPVISVAILFGILKDVSLTGLNITKKTTIIAIVVFAMAILNIALNFLLIPIYKAQGAAIATLTARVASFIIFYLIAQKYYFIPYEISKVILIVIVGLALISISVLLTINNIYLSVMFKIMLVIIFPVVLYYLNFFEPVELKRISEIWREWKNPKNWLENIKKIKF